MIDTDGKSIVVTVVTTWNSYGIREKRPVGDTKSGWPGWKIKSYSSAHWQWKKALADSDHQDNKQIKQKYIKCGELPPRTC